jgi:AhpC/TSA family
MATKKAKTYTEAERTKTSDLIRWFAVRIIFYTLLLLLPCRLSAQTDSLMARLQREKILFVMNASELDTGKIIVAASLHFKEVSAFSILGFRDRPLLADSIKQKLYPNELKDSIVNQWVKLEYKVKYRDSTVHALLNQPLPDFDARDTSGRIHRPMQYRRRVLLLHFFHFFGNSYADEIPILNELIGKYYGQGLEILSFTDIPFGKSEQEWLTRKPMNFPIIPNAKPFFDQYLPVRLGEPSIVLVDKIGNIREIYHGDIFRITNQMNQTKEVEATKRRALTDEWAAKISALLKE